MARIQRTALFSDLLILLGRLPWWINLVFALLSWLLLHPFASSALPVLGRVEAGGALTDSLFRQLARFAQYLLPLGFCTVALVALGYRVAQHRQMRSRPAPAPAALLQSMQWPAFRLLLEQAFRSKGYRVLGNTLAGADGSCDLLLQQAGERYLVHCRYWQARRLKVAPLREFFARVVSEGAAGGVVVTKGEFSAEARAFAAERQLELVDGTRLQRWVAVSRKRV
ncbi:restriction endonuclease [Halopseudomonas sabulinigri]|uniref:Restriction endonuclease n=1 Tax=Halopseudomonas sabulinigri TaxID=472181 RepID=A0ABP9ZSB6_9GAMM